MRSAHGLVELTLASTIRDGLVVAALHQRRLDGLDAALLLAKVVAGSKGGVEITNSLLSMHLDDASGSLSADPRLVHLGTIVVRQITSFIEDGQAHDVEDGMDVTNLLHLEHPARRHPRPGAGRVKPKINCCGHGTSQPHAPAHAKTDPVIVRVRRSNDARYSSRLTRQRKARTDRVSWELLGAFVRP